MVLQLEDYTGILKSLHPGIYFVFIFDHPCGHNRVREDRLNSMKMNSGYGGAQREIRPTNIKQEVGYLFPYEKIIELGGEKHMLFQEGSNGPF